MPVRRILRLTVPQRPARYFAIVSSANDYRLCWEMNNALGWHLTAATPCTLPLGNGTAAAFPRFVHDANRFGCTLTVNRNQFGTLIPHLSQTDYILDTDASEDDVPSAELLSAIKALPSVSLATTITDTARLARAIRKIQSFF